jgi:hypothetical protein
LVHQHKKLDLVRNIKLSGEIKPNGTSGLWNQVLESNSSGGMAWRAIPFAGWATVDHANFDNNFKTTYPKPANRVLKINSPILSQGGNSGLYKNGGLSIYNSSYGKKCRIYDG